MRMLRSEYLQLHQSELMTHVENSATGEPLILVQANNSTQPQILSGGVPVIGQHESVMSIHNTLPINENLRNNITVPTGFNALSVSLNNMRTPALATQHLMALYNVPNIIQNITFHFEERDTQWYSRFYKSFEGEMWYKTLRNSTKPYTRWYYHCMLCSRRLCAFENLRNHMNSHFGFLPYRCPKCGKRYGCLRSLTSHKHTKHPTETKAENVSNA